MISNPTQPITVTGLSEFGITNHKFIKSWVEFDKEQGIFYLEKLWV